MEFLQQNWQYLLSAFIAILTLIAALIRKKPSSSLFSEVMLDVLTELPGLINRVECAGNGKEKKAIVLDTAIELFEKRIGRDLTGDELKAASLEISADIEEILSTPTKKEEKLCSDVIK